MLPEGLIERAANPYTGFNLLSNVGLLLSALCAATLFPSVAGPQGSYSASGVAAIPWRINEHHALIWNNAPYLPVGLRISGTADEIKRAADAAIKDVAVELPVSGMGWKQTFQALEAARMRYLIVLDSLAPGVTGVAVEPQSLRISGITQKRTIELSIPGATSAFVVLATRYDGEVRKTAIVQTPNGKLVYEADPPNTLEHVLLIYPQITSWSVVDCWDGMDRQRDSLLQSLKEFPPGPGLRGIVNPVGSVFKLRAGRTFVPTSPLFRYEFRQYLRNHYQSADTVIRAWSMSASEIETLDELCRLVPLWSGTRGVSLLLDPSTNKTYVCESKRSSIWQDIETVLNAATARRFRNIASAIRQVCNVPVLQEWADWGSPYESGTAVLDGLAVKTSGTSLTSIAETAGRAASSLFRWGRPGWLAATRIEIPPTADHANSIGAVLDDLTSMGYRAFFVRAADATLLQSIASEASRRATDGSLASWSPSAVYFPESAMNPAAIMRLPGGSWWLPAPVDGNRVSLGNSYFSYRLQDGENSVLALWGKVPAQRVKLRVIDAAKLTFTSLDGSDPNPRRVKGGVEVNLSQIPLLLTGTDEIPVPEPALLETLERFDQLQKAATSRGVDITQAAFLFRDAQSSLDRTPGGSFAAMIAQVEKLSERLGRHNWIEAENIVDTNFSELVQVPGTSGGSVLRLVASLPGNREEHVAEYVVRPRTEQELTVWLAARIPRENRKALVLSVGSQEMRIESEPVGYYGQGFAWYRMGVTRLKGETKMTIRVSSEEEVELALDAILFVAEGFTPNGLTRPDPF